MFVQVDKTWDCGHIGYFTIEWCLEAFKGYKEPSADHDLVEEPRDPENLDVPTKCSDCIRKETMPETSPFYRNDMNKLTRARYSPPFITWFLERCYGVPNRFFI